MTATPTPRRGLILSVLILTTSGHLVNGGRLAAGFTPSSDERRRWDENPHARAPTGWIVKPRATSLGMVPSARTKASFFPSTILRPIRDYVLARRRPSQDLPRPEHVAKFEVEEEDGKTYYRRVFFVSSREDPSWILPWHDIPLDTSAETPLEKWMVVEIPLHMRAKLEMSVEEPLNPIIQQQRDGKLLQYPLPMEWNYGFIPQTWEDSTTEHGAVGFVGDGDPLDVIDFGSRVRGQGEVRRIRILGALALIDKGELDWKLIAIDVEDELAREIRTLEDLKRVKPIAIPGLLDWIQKCKPLPPGQTTLFGFGGEVLGQEKARRSR